MRTSFMAPLLALLLAGCASPKIVSYTVEDGVEGTPLPAAATIDPRNSSIGTPDVRYRAISTGTGTLSNAVAMNQEGAGDTWTTQVQGLRYGSYEVHLRVPFSTILGQTSKRLVKRVWIRPRPDCFSFDGEERGTEGWTFEGIFDATGATDIRKPGCPGTDLLWSGVQWPDPLGIANPGPDRGSLHVLLSHDCFPTDPADLESGFWRFGFVSPDLASNSGWQGVDVVEFRVAATGVLKLQPIVTFIREDGTVGNSAPTDPTTGDFLFYGVEPSAWTTFAGPVAVPANATVTGVRIRVFGEPAVVQLLEGAPRDIYLDSVCPIRD